MLRINRIGIGLAPALLLVPALGCVQVLGLEEAELADHMHGSSDPAMFRGVTNQLNACTQEPVPACKQCLQGSCASTMQACVADADCRLELDRFDFCLGMGCGGDQEECSFDLRPDVAACAQSCPDECEGQRLVTECELLCACMQEICASEAANDCMPTCLTLPAEVATCRRKHCGAAGNVDGAGRTLHCQHASDAIHVCLTRDELALDERATCTDGAETTWACDVDDDCCSGVCSDGACQ